MRCNPFLLQPPSQFAEAKSKRWTAPLRRRKNSLAAITCWTALTLMRPSNTRQ
ncbi:UNVERIFIED_CONTAM: hypothetical protein GTU68_060088 [Idotea baltica]|nr:hypothetical protein [Idotea baltica]